MFARYTKTPMEAATTAIPISAKSMALLRVGEGLARTTEPRNRTAQREQKLTCFLPTITVASLLEDGLHETHAVSRDLARRHDRGAGRRAGRLDVDLDEHRHQAQGRASGTAKHLD